MKNNKKEYCLHSIKGVRENLEQFDFHLALERKRNSLTYTLLIVLLSVATRMFRGLMYDTYQMLYTFYTKTTILENLKD